MWGRGYNESYRVIVVCMRVSMNAHASMNAYIAMSVDRPNKNKMKWDKIYDGNNGPYLRGAYCHEENINSLDRNVIVLMVQDT